MKLLCTLLFVLCISNTVFSQEVSIDGRLKPILDEYFEECKRYGINFQEKLFKLEKISIVNDLPASEGSAILGKVRRNEAGEVKSIAIHWMAMLDPEILKIVAFHEFSHYFLGYETHICEDCGIIMARVNSSYFEIANDWERQVKKLFIESPAFKQKSVASIVTAF